ncbi:sugar ABC transporter permease [Paenibacillus sp. LHD-117]|uniref:carbohydrate ABC transporter permease n=1 Tax=Paenibacillus sp. LHD-117 TaxID=3071412 RepID=UPI0027DF84C9|nr:sugar ABC transporter permease [Paenibacillus sp. LHD-117]MDQ6419783.1 sugar ABC transporter permease [Paenibacillus sp. LHD-117]
MKFKSGLRQWAAVLPYVAIGFIGIAVFVIYPMIRNIMISFQDYSIMPNAENPWVGFDNYTKVFEDPNDRFLIALRNTFLNVLGTVPINWFLAIFFAVLINAKFVKFKIAFRTVYYLPIVTSWIIIALLFKYLFADGDGGFINYILHKQLGILNEPIAWRSNYWSAMVMIWLFHIWKTVGWGVVIYLAALQGIPKDLYEAAEIDGANANQRFWRVTIPLLKPITLFIVINLINGAFGFFPQVYFITQGGPMNQTHVIPSLIYIEAFQNLKFGPASAMGVMMGLLVFVLTYTQMKKIGRQKMF